MHILTNYCDCLKLSHVLCCFTHCAQSYLVPLNPYVPRKYLLRRHPQPFVTLFFLKASLFILFYGLMSTNINDNDDIPNQSRQTSAPSKNNAESQQLNELRIFRYAHFSSNVKISLSFHLCRRVFYCQMDRSKNMSIGMCCFTLIAITVGVLVVCFASRQRTGSFPS